MMYGIQDVFPPEAAKTELDSILDKKLKQGEGAWANVKEILGMTFGRTDKTIWLATMKRYQIIKTLRYWIRLTKHKGGIPFEEFWSVLSKLQHAFLMIPVGKGVLSTFYAVLSVQLRFVFLHNNLQLFNAVVDCQKFLRESVSFPTTCRNLVTAWSEHPGVGGCIISKNMQVPPQTVFRFQWPRDISDLIVSDENPNGTISNSDIEMAGLLLSWLVMEDVCPTTTPLR
jgi:hypothetical protein